MRALTAVVFGVVLAVALAPVAVVAVTLEEMQEMMVADIIDDSLALSLWGGLAEQGNAVAQNNLGNIYDNGQGVPKDYAEAVRWYRLAAGQGNISAQNNLGVMYREGRGVPQEYAEALKWFQLAAEQGYALAQQNLGLIYANGRGVPQDYVQAHMWLNLAAAHLPPGADRYGAVENRDAVAELMTPDQMAEAQKLAGKWRPRGERAD